MFSAPPKKTGRSAIFMFITPLSAFILPITAVLGLVGEEDNCCEMAVVMAAVANANICCLHLRLCV